MGKKNDWLFTVTFTVLIVMVILAFFILLRSTLQSIEDDAEIHEIMESAQERIDIYEAASRPAQVRPALMISVPSETPEPVEDWYIESIPLDKPLQRAVFDAACEFGVDYFLALGLIKVESNFQADAVNQVSGCYGLCQLNPAWFPSGLSPEDNVLAGLEHLGNLLDQYGDTAAALRAYNRGYDDGDRRYSNAVMSAAEEIMAAAGVVAK